MATAYLGAGRVGVLVSGGRAIWEGGKLGEIRDASMELAYVLPVAPALGGGFVLVGKNGTYFAQTFDGALLKLSGAPQAFEGRIGPHVIQTGVWLVSTSTGQPVNGAPENVSELYAHQRLGFAIAIDDNDALWHSRDGRVWKKLATLSNVHDGVEDGDALVLLGHENNATRVSADGKLTSVKLTDDERMTLAFKRVERSPLAEPFEGAFIDDAWTPSGRSPDEWLVVRGRDVLLAHAPELVTKKIATAPEEGCAALTLERPLLACVTLGRRLHVFHLDLATGATELEKAIDVATGIASRIGTAPGSYPSTLLITARCSGANPNEGLCVRDDQGGWREWPGTIPQQSQILPYPEGTIVLDDDAGAIEMRVMGHVVRTIASADYEKLARPLEESSLEGDRARRRHVLRADAAQADRRSVELGHAPSARSVRGALAHAHERCRRDRGQTRAPARSRQALRHERRLDDVDRSAAASLGYAHRSRRRDVHGLGLPRRSVGAHRLVTT